MKNVLIVLMLMIGSSAAVAQQCKPPVKLVCTTQGNQTVCECRLGGGGTF